MEPVSVIHDTLWEEAIWTGVAYDSDHNMLPLLVPIYEYVEATEKLFELMVEDIGIEDPNERLRVSIIFGVDQSSPDVYRVLFCDNAENISGNFRARIFQCSKNSSDDLENFIAKFEKTGKFAVLPAAITEEGSATTIKTHIVKTQLFVKDAWQIGTTDLDAYAIRKGDNPVIPSSETNAPVTELLKLLNEESLFK
jgi:hypothetical protein